MKKDYNIKYIYKNEGKNFDKILESLFKKYLITYENKKENETHYNLQKNYTRKINHEK